MTRKETKVINIGGRKIGGGNPVAIQSMTNTKTEDVETTVAQILALEKAGCEIIRCAVPNMEAAQALQEIKKQIHIPQVGQDTTSIPPFLSPSAFRISFALLISSNGSPVSDTRIVSPIP